jgi:hypothetical protein
MAFTSIVNKQRQLSSEDDLPTQLETLQSLIKNPPQNSRVVEITPDVAEFVLATLNVNNRPRKAKKIIEYRQDMQKNNWSLTGETIKFGSDGFLKDGQNRMAACVQAQTPFTTHAVFGIDPQTFHHMDTGKPRGANDVLAIMGVKNADKVSLTVKLLLAWEKGRTNTQNSVKNQEVKDAYLNTYKPELLQTSVAVAKKVYNQTRFPVGHVSATYYLATERGLQQEADEFFSSFMSQTGTATSGPIKLQKHLTKLRGERAHISSHDYAVLLSRAFHCFVNKKRMTSDMLRVTLADKRMPMRKGSVLN